jgi:hypothetical protein
MVAVSDGLLLMVESLSNVGSQYAEYSGFHGTECARLCV